LEVSFLGILDKLIQPSTKDERPNFTGAQIFLALTLSIGTVFAASIYLGPWIELGSGVKETDDCAETPIVSFDQDFVTNMSGNPSRLTGVSVDGIPLECSGRYFRLNLFDASNNLLESVVWQSALVSSTDTAIRAVADGITTLNRSDGGTSIVYPSDETDPLGLVLENVDPELVDSFSLESSEQPLQELD
jgi:hypothetical protein